MMLSLRKVIASPKLVTNGANPIYQIRCAAHAAQKPLYSIKLPKGVQKGVKKERVVVEKKVEIPKITAMKEYSPEVKTHVKKEVFVKSTQKPKKDRVLEHFLGLGRLRKFTAPEEFSAPYYHSEVRDPVGQFTEEPYAPDLFMRGACLGGSAKVMVLNDYDSYNTLTPALTTRLNGLVKKWEHDNVITSIVWESSCRNFSAGVDYQSTFSTPSEGLAFMKERHEMAYRIYTMRKPFVPILSGLILGNSSYMGLLANSSMATDTSVFAIPEPSFGYIPDSGIPFALSRTGIRGLGEFLATTGYTLRGQDLHHSRLARYYIPDERIPAAEIELGTVSTNKISRFLTSVTAVHEPIRRYDFSLRNKLPIIGPCFDKDTIQEVFKALDASDDIFAKELLTKMKTFSPLSLAVTHRLVREALDRNIEYSLKSNFIAAQKYDDYSEGVRAKMENRAPKWKHNSVFEVTKEEVEAIFTNNSNTSALELEASSYVPLNGAIFRYIQAKNTPTAHVGGSFYAEHDVDDARYNIQGKFLYRRSQAKADRLYYRMHPDKVNAWLPGGEMLQQYIKEEAKYNASEDDAEEGGITEEVVENYLDTASSASTETGLLPDYEFLKTPDPPVQDDLVNKLDEDVPDSASPYYEVVEEEEFIRPDDVQGDDDLIKRPSDAYRAGKSRTNLLDSYEDEAKVSVPVPTGEKMWVRNLDREDEY